jgi:hypothetical protein
VVTTELPRYLAYYLARYGTLVLLQMGSGVHHEREIRGDSRERMGKHVNNRY